MAQCPNCGTQASAKFCPNCGAQMPQVPPVAAAPQAPPQMPPQQYPPQAAAGYPQQPQAYPPQQFPPQGYNPYGQQMPPRKSGSPLKWIGIIGGSLVALIAVVLVILTALGGGGSGVTSTPIITDKVNQETQQPIGSLTNVPPATDMIYAAVEVDVKKGDVLSAKWYYNGNLQSQLNTELPVDDDFAGWGAFNISNAGKPWPKGSYKVELYYNGEKAQEKTFEVK